MLKNISKLECKVNDKTFQFLCDSDSVIAEVKEALFQFMKFAGDVECRAKLEAEEKSKVESIAVTEEIEVIKLQTDEIKPE